MNDLPQKTLTDQKALETLVKMRIKKLMKESIPYKQIYQEVKEIIEGQSKKLSFLCAKLFYLPNTVG